MDVRADRRVAFSPLMNSLPGSTTPNPMSNSQRAIGKSFDAMRPLKGSVRAKPGEGSFPVYDNLEDRLSRAGAAGPDEVARHVCSVLAGWAYSNAETVADMMTRLGLQESRVRAFSVSNNSMFIQSTAYLVQSKDGRVALLAYRGTDPFDLSTWAADYDVNPTAIKVPLGSEIQVQAGSVMHAGFYRNQRSSWFDIASGLKNALNRKSILDDLGPVESTENTIQPLEALYITGHSLGAAMAGVAAFRIATDPSYRRTIWPLVRAVYTFAQPMIGNAPLKATCESIPGFIEKYFVHVYGKDVVPHLPPSLTGGFVHFGTIFESDQSGPEKSTRQSFRWVPSKHAVLPVQSVLQLVAAVVALVTKQVVKPGSAQSSALSLVRFLMPGGLREIAELAAERVLERLLADIPIEYSFYDHSATNYIACSQPANVMTEFGDF
jgi:Lipase (class 3)